MPISVGEIVSDPDFANTFQVLRSSGEWNIGVFEVTATQTLSLYGTIEVDEPRNLNETVDADITGGKIKVYTQEQIYTTHNGSNPGFSDIIVWNGYQHRVLEVTFWGSFGFGYWRSVASRLNAA